MPSKSKAQAKLMRGAAYNADFARKVDIPQDVARDYADSDKKRGTSKLPPRKGK
jgi:hypothetical protein